MALSPPARRGVTLPAVLLALLAMLLVTVAPGSAEALAASYPVISKGNRGVDVRAAQYLLQSRGHSVATDGVFGSDTDGAVKAFQRASGLAADGVAGANTWGQLVRTLQSGSSGPAVRALQLQLNEKRKLSLSVDGEFGAATRSAVVAFQRHAGISDDGVVGPNTWKNLLWHYAYPSFGHLCDKDPDGNGTANWGTASAIGQIEAAAADFAATGQGKVPLGDVSKEHGGDIAGHASHEVGVDVDIWPIRTDSAQCTGARITWQSSAYDRAATRALVKAVRANAPGQVVVIYFNDPTLIFEGLTTRYDNHDNHLHIRYG